MEPNLPDVLRDWQELSNELDRARLVAILIRNMLSIRNRLRLSKDLDPHLVKRAEAYADELKDIDPSLHARLFHKDAEQ